MNRLVEALRRILIIVVWSPTAIAAFVIILNVDETLNQIDKAGMIIGACVFGGLITHYIINWIFQINERPLLSADNAEDDYDDRPLLPEAYMEKNRIWHFIICMVWMVGIIFLGNTRNGYSTPPWEVWYSFKSFLNYQSIIWPYLLIAIGGAILFLYLVKANYLRYLKRLGY